MPNCQLATRHFPVEVAVQVSRDTSGIASTTTGGVARHLRQHHREPATDLGKASRDTVAQSQTCWGNALYVYENNTRNKTYDRFLFPGNIKCISLPLFPLTHSLSTRRHSGSRPCILHFAGGSLYPFWPGSSHCTWAGPATTAATTSPWASYCERSRSRSAAEARACE